MRRYATPLAVALALFCLAVGASSASAAAPPKISLTAFSEVTTDSVTLKATIDPQGKATSYRFEYGPSDCSSNPCTSVPGPTISGVSPPTPVTAEIEGLTPGGTYHFRVVAKNLEGEVKGPDVAFTIYVLEQGFGHCPNDSFRSGPSARLPDCRAYEQASPVDKNGADVNGDTDEIQAASTGGAVTFFSAAGLPGGVGAQDFETYLARRGPGGWSTSGAYPPASAGPVARNAGWTPNLSQFFSNAAGSFEGPWTFRSRSSASGTFTPISVDAKRGGFLAGASADGSKVYFQNEGPLLPNAAPGLNNLYVWDRGTNTVSLAGILPDSACAAPPCVPPGGSFAGPYAWFSGEGNAGQGSRSYYIQDEHAISADGSKAYFTAGGGQIYLRKDATSLGATTVHVSASQKTNGPGGGPDAAGARPAAFMAAATDGSVGLFTSAVKLTNDATTGPEPLIPSIGRLDIEGNPESVEPGFLPNRATGLAVNAEHLYWADPAAGTIGRAKLNGVGGATEVDDEFINTSGKPQWVAVDAEHIYWTNAGGLEGDTIGRADINGSPASVDPEFIPSQVETSPGVVESIVDKPQGIAVNAEHVFWANDATNAIARAEIDGANPQPRWHEIGSTEVPQGVALDATHIYWTTNNPNSWISRADLDGSNEIFKSVNWEGSSSEVRGLAVDSAHVYWVRQAANDIGRANLDLSGIEEGFTTAEGKLKGLAVDAEHIYWSTNGDALPNPGNDLYRFDAGTGDLTDLTVDTSDENGAEVKGVLGTSDDGSYAYFAANGVLAANVGAQGAHASPGDCKGFYGGLTLDFTGECSLYLSHAGATTFIARLDASTDATDWAPVGTGIHTSENTARVSADGQTLLFLSRGQFYRYHLGDPLVCVSCNPTGAPITGAPHLQSIRPSLSVVLPPGSPPIRTRNLSADGNQVFFESSDKLVAADVNGEDGCSITGQSSVPSCQDVYEWEAEGSGSCESSAQNGGCLYLLSGGTSPEPSFFADASASGEDAFIFSRESLVPQDKDRILDVYDVRAGGGLASQHQPPPFPCEAEGCKAEPSTPPSTQSPGTSSFTGPGNQAGPKPKPRCPKGKRRARSHGKSRCVAKHQRHRDRKHRDANPTRKASR